MSSNLTFHFDEEINSNLNSKLITDVKKSVNHVTPAGPITFPTDDRYSCYAEAKYSTSAEYKKPVKCEIIGSIPKWIDGNFLRLGPGRFEWGTTKVKHYFDGDALLHCFSITQGTVTYHSRFLDTTYHKKNEKYNRVATMGVGTYAPPDPCASFFQRIMMYFIPNVTNDNTNVNVVKMNDRAFASTETPWMLEINPKTLETMKEMNATSQLGSATRLWLAHPHYDEDGNYWMFSSNPKIGHYELIKVPNYNTVNPIEKEQVMTVLKSSGKFPCYYHSFSMTKNFIILLENPFSLESVMQILTINMTKKSILDLMKWKPSKGSIFRIICRKTFKELRTCKADAAFVFHHANAFEKDGFINIDSCAYPDDSVINYLYMENITNALKGQTYSRPNLYRYQIPIAEIQKQVKDPYILNKDFDGKDFEVLAANIETPIINYNAVNGKDYKYVYGITDIFFRSSLIKVNVQTKESIYWKVPKYYSASEPMFIKSPTGCREDDGVIVSTVTGCKNEKSFLIVLDANTFKEIARAVMPVPMALMIHGSYWPNKELS